MFYDNKYAQSPIHSHSHWPARLRSGWVHSGCAARCGRLNSGANPVNAGRPVRRRPGLTLALAALGLLAPLAPLASLAPLGALGALVGAAPAQAQAQAPSLSLERKVKAAFLYKFLGYTEFPAAALGEAGAPVVIGVVDADDLAAELNRIVGGRTVNARPIAVKVFREQDAPIGVHLLFVGGNDPARVRMVLRSAPSAPMLLVTEAEEGLRQGSVINFRIVDERVRFDVSLEAAEKNSVRLSSRLLTVANQVFKGVP